jgi:hypothetical protein
MLQKVFSTIMKIRMKMLKKQALLEIENKKKQDALEKNQKKIYTEKYAV